MTMRQEIRRFGLLALMLAGFQSVVSAAPAIQPQLTVQLGHSADVFAVAFSPDSRFVATGGRDAGVCLWDIATGVEIRRFIHQFQVWSVAFSPDGRFLLTKTSSLIKERGDYVYVWDTATGVEVQRFAGRAVEVHTPAFSPDSRLLVVAEDDYTVRFWEIATGQDMRRLSGHTDKVAAVAFSPDGQLVLTGSVDTTARLWDVHTGAEVRRFAEHSGSVLLVAFSPDGRLVLTASEDNTVRLWETDTGREVQHFVGLSARAVSVTFSAEGDTILVQTAEKMGHLWNIVSGQEIRQFQKDELAAVSPAGRLVVTRDTSGRTLQLQETATGQLVREFANGSPIAVSPDNRFLLIENITEKTLQVWEVATGQDVQQFAGRAAAVRAVAFSADGRFVVTGSNGNGAHIWEIATGKVAQHVGQEDSVRSVAFSPDGRFVVTGGWTARLWEVTSGKEVRQFGGYSLRTVVAFSPDGRFVATGLSDNTVRLWEAATGKEVRRFDHQFPVNAVAFSLDGRFIVTGSGDSNPLSAFSFSWRSDPKKKQDAVLLWDVQTGAIVRGFGSSFVVNAVAFSPDGRLITVENSSATSLWDVASGQWVGLVEGLSFNGTPAVFSPDGRLILTGSTSFWQELVSVDFTANLYTLDGKRVQQFLGHSYSVHAVTFSPDGRWVVTGSGDGTVRFWSPTTGRELCRLLSFGDDTWVVVDPEGRFDTNNLDNNPGLYWVMPDDPFTPLPLEIFMRDYYEPRLLPRILAGEQLKPVRSLQSLNRVQPDVQTVKIEPRTDVPDSVVVTVAVGKASRVFQRDGKEVMIETGVYDLRLFRDGQLVGYAPDRSGELSVDPQTGKATQTFLVNLPRLLNVQHIEFFAYAFNVDRVKSTTDRKTFALPADLPPDKGRAYLITIGVNAYENPTWDLRFAANDARQLQQVVSKALRRTGRYDDIVTVPLLSDAEVRDGRRVITENRATKKHIQTVLQLLAGKQRAAEYFREIPNSAELRPARPEDLVLLSFSSHGYADNRGIFYFFPSDIGAGQGPQITETVLQRSISSDELSLWFRDIDAGELVLIVDACHAAATVEQEGFKPGPMGSQGLGQLAYDKGMRILAASQAAEVALESDLIQQGLLTYALVHEGLEAGQADFQPQDHMITLGEWLSYGVQRVPLLYDEIRSGQVQTLDHTQRERGVVVLMPQHADLLRGRSSLQQPALFDFARQRPPVVLVQG
jgi:WD40 repeat protein